MKNLKFTILTLILALIVVPVAHAEEATEDRVPKKQALLEGLKKIGARAAIGNCKLEAKTGTTLTCTKDGKTYTIDAANALMRRKFGGKSTVEEMAVGHILSVAGTWTDEAKTQIEAKVVRDTSIQKRKGVFVGKVTTLNVDGWVMTTQSAKRPNQTVTILASTPIANRKGDQITQADVAVGDRVQVEGLWDNTANTVTEVTKVKDFSQPAKATVTPTP